MTFSHLSGNTKKCEKSEYYLYAARFFLIYYFVSVAFYGLHPYMFPEEKISFSISLNFGLKLQKSSLQ